MPGVTDDNGVRSATMDAGRDLPLSFAAEGFGLVILDATRPDVVGRAAHAVEAVLRLAAVEPRLQWFERWWGREFDWRPGATPEHDADLTLVSLDDTGDMIGIDLSADVDALPALPDDTDDIASLRWNHASRRLWLERERLDADDRQRLAPGALVLLSATFDAAPVAWLESRDRSLRPVRLEGDRVLPVPESEPVAGSTCDRREPDVPEPVGWLGCYCEVALRVDRLSRWAEGEPLCQAPVPDTRVWLELGESPGLSNAEPESRWTGRLTRVGDGLGVLIDTSIDGLGRR